MQHTVFPIFKNYFFFILFTFSSNDNSNKKNTIEDKSYVSWSNNNVIPIHVDFAINAIVEVNATFTAYSFIYW